MARPTIPVRLSIEARDALNRLSFRLTGDSMKRVELSEALLAACEVAEANYDKTLTALKREGESKTDD